MRSPILAWSPALALCLHANRSCKKGKIKETPRKETLANNIKHNRHNRHNLQTPSHTVHPGKSTPNVLSTHAWSSCFDSQSLDRCTVQRWSEACAEILRSSCENTDTWNIWSRNSVMPVKLEDPGTLSLSMPQTSKTFQNQCANVIVCSTCISIYRLLCPMKLGSISPATAHFSPGNIAWGPGLSVLSKRLVLWTEKNISGSPSGYHLSHAQKTSDWCAYMHWHALTCIDMHWQHPESAWMPLYFQD